jgi:hypothetical protein
VVFACYAMPYVMYLLVSAASTVPLCVCQLLFCYESESIYD